MAPAAEPAPPGIGPYQLAWRRLRRNHVALAFGGLFLVIVIACMLSPVYAHHIAHTGPADNHVTDQVRVGGKLVNVVSETGIPIGPTGHCRQPMLPASKGTCRRVRGVRPSRLSWRTPSPSSNRRWPSLLHRGNDGRFAGCCPRPSVRPLWWRGW